MVEKLASFPQWKQYTRVDVKSPGVSTDLTQNTWDRSRSVCFQNKSPVDNFCHLETRAGAMACDACNLN